MTAFLDAISQLPMAARVALAALVVVQLTLQIYGVVDLSRRTHVPGGRKWPWLLLLLFGQLFGAIVYLAAGRSAAPSAEPTARAGSGGAAAPETLDSLYGGRRKP